MWWEKAVENFFYVKYNITSLQLAGFLITRYKRQSIAWQNEAEVFHTAPNRHLKG